MKSIKIKNSKIFFWAITLKESGKHIGNIKIDPISQKHERGEYGIMMGDRSEWGKGYAREASEAVIRFCFETLKLRKVTLGVLTANRIKPIIANANTAPPMIAKDFLDRSFITNH